MRRELCVRAKLASVGPGDACEDNRSKALQLRIGERSALQVPNEVCLDVARAEEPGIRLEEGDGSLDRGGVSLRQTPKTIGEAAGKGESARIL